MNNIFKKIEPKAISENLISLIGDDWMLITAGDSEKFNTMTASWGMMGFLWGKPVAQVFIRPQRYTFEFTEKNNTFTLSFFDSSMKDALKLCGTVSGRNTDKVKECGLTPVITENGSVAFKEAKIVIECKKLYVHDFNEKEFKNKDLIPAWYKDGDFHRAYTAEILNVWTK